MTAKSLASFSLALLCTLAAAQETGRIFTEASDLTLVGKLIPDTPNPYHRVDTVRFKGFTALENKQVRMSAGISVAFRTDSKTITVRTDFADRAFPSNTTALSARGYDLYIFQDGRWVWAGSGVAPDKKPDSEVTIVRNMDGSMHECLLYLPVFSEENSIKIGTDEGSVIEASANPFRYRIGVFGSSFTHGTSTTRAGMPYICQLGRLTGFQFLSIGCGGHCKMQDYYADVLCAADVDAFLFDCFSNPGAELIEKRLFPFIEKIQKAHPGVPLIFQSTLYREGRRFDTAVERFESAKMAMADSLMRIAVRKYDDVYYIKTACPVVKAHETTVDGTHPSDYGHTLWATSVAKPLRRILRKYGIK